ncbi:hypothetical protein C8Q75DRAFT_754562 [Abortiporus biennis]|nr:hypothetical protein C8Q75DRAFT_754562 [Abortiporus biennis]
MPIFWTGDSSVTRSDDGLSETEDEQPAPRTNNDAPEELFNRIVGEESFASLLWEALFQDDLREMEVERLLDRAQERGTRYSFGSVEPPLSPHVSPPVASWVLDSDRPIGETLSEPTTPLAHANFTLDDQPQPSLVPQPRDSESVRSNPPAISIPSLDGHPRFSTVVQHRAHSVTIQHPWEIGSVEETSVDQSRLQGPLPVTTVVVAESSHTIAESPSPATERSHGVSSSTRPAVNVDASPQCPSSSPTSSSSPTLHNTITEPAVISELEIERDPPVLTDGRGRVVWSSMSASRNRRGRSTIPAQSQRPPAAGSGQAKTNVPLRREISETVLQSD